MKISDYKVIILCGGKGTRISEHSLTIPKPMVKIGNSPILLHILNHYYHFNIKKFILAIGYKGDQIIKYFTKVFPKINNLTKKIFIKKNYIKIIYSNNVEIILVKTGMTSETGGRILQCRSFLEKNETFFLTYGDGLSNINILKTLNIYKKLKK
jgi:glucose-1-phosphate cytidylyltransferase